MHAVAAAVAPTVHPSNFRLTGLSNAVLKPPPLAATALIASTMLLCGPRPEPVAGMLMGNTLPMKERMPS